MTTRLARALLLPAVLVASACHGEPAGPAAETARLVLVDGPPAAVVAGSGTPAAFRVAALDGSDEPVEGLRLRLAALEGGGAVEPASAVTDGEGEVRATYRPGSSPGEARIRIDAPAAHGVSPLIVPVVQEPSVVLRLRSGGGEDQEAEPGSQLPRPFRVTALRPDGTPAAGVVLDWSLSREPGGARLEPLSLATDTAGRAAALLTLSPEPGVHEIRVHGGESAAGDTLVFTARGVGDPAPEFRIDSVSPLPLEPGSRATIHGEGIPGAEAGVRVEGEPAEILERSAARMEIRVPPAEECRPDRTVGVRVVAGERTSNGLMVGLNGPGERLDLEPGEIRTLGPEAAGCMQLAGSDGTRSYRLVLQDVARSSAGTRPLRLVTRAGGGDRGSAGAGRSMAPDAGARRRAGGGRSAGEPRDAAVDPDADGARSGTGIARRLESGIVPRLQERARRELRRRGARPAAGEAGGSAVRRAAEGAAEGADGGADGRAAAEGDGNVPREGDLLKFHFAVGTDLSVSCADTSRAVAARVRAVSPSVVLAQDTAGAGGFGDADHRLLSREFHQVVFPTDTTYFGAPSDLDDNGRVVVLFSPRVNELTPRGADAAVGGFFLPLDLADSGDGTGVPGPGGETCPASNEAEILYLPVPDPEGVHGPEFSRDAALRNARGIVAHELMHLLSVSQRVIVNGGGFLALDEVWLAEGLSHLAEEVVGHSARETSSRSGLGFRDFSATREGLEAFNTFHLQNFGRLQLFLLDPGGAPALSAVDPGGVASLRMRGHGWLLVRWLADRFATPETEAELIRRLSTGGPSALTGIDNVTAAAGVEWRALLEDFALVPLLEGRDLPAADPASSERASRARLTTWELRDVYAGLSENPGSRALFPLGYPLDPAVLPFGNALRSLELEAGTARYMALSAGTSSPALSLSVGGPGGLPLPAGAPVHVTVVRFR